MYTEKRRKTFRAGFGKGKNRNATQDSKSFLSQPKETEDTQLETTLSKNSKKQRRLLLITTIRHRWP